MTEPIDQHDAKRCPICGKPSLARFRPFCSARCADVDLNRWLSGAYRLPAVEEDAADEAVPQAPDEKQA